MVDQGAAVAAPPADKGRDRLAAVLYPLATFTILLLARQFLVRLFGVPEYGYVGVEATGVNR